MNRRLTRTLVGIVTAVLVVASVAFGIVVSTHGGANAKTPRARSVIPAVEHPTDGSMADCAGCHAADQGGMPRSHLSYSAATCLTCHLIAAAPPAEAIKENSTGPAGPVPHSLTGPYRNCVGCHVIGGRRSMPKDHDFFDNRDCTNCHAGPEAK
jgi:hypothetical protein